MVTKETRIWVISSPDGNVWEISQQGQTALESFAAKEDAIERARRLVKDQTGEVVVHASDGTVEAVYTSETFTEGADDPLLELSGIGRSGSDDVSERTNDILREEWQKSK